MKKFLTVLLLLGLALALAITACDDGNNTETHTHDYGTAWKSNAAEHWRECSCGDKTDVGDHEWEWQETKQPTATQEGEETETCKTCGAESGNTRPIAMLPQNQTATLTNLFGEGYTATVTGYFSNTEWQGSGASSVPTKIETALNGAFTAATNPVKTRFRNVFGVPNNTVNIIVEKMTEEGRTFKVDGTQFDDVIQLRLNFNALDNDDLQSKITSAVRAMNGDDGFPLEG